MGRLVDGDLLDLLVDVGVTGLGEVGRGEVGERLRVEGRLEVLKGERKVEDHGWRSLVRLGARRRDVPSPVPAAVSDWRLTMLRFICATSETATALATSATEARARTEERMVGGREARCGDRFCRRAGLQIARTGSYDGYQEWFQHLSGPL